jgi:hypothetical protein
MKYDDLLSVLTSYGNQSAKKYPYLFGDNNQTIKEKNRAYDDWIRYEVWKSAKMENFYEAMISRDYKAVTLNDDVVREIFEYL